MSTPQQNIGQEVIAEIEKLQQMVAGVQLPIELKEKAEQMVARVRRVAKLGSYSKEFEPTQKYIEWITRIPWGKFTEDNLELPHAKKVLDSNHYGLNQIKDRILEYLAVIKLKGGLVKQSSQTSQSGQTSQTDQTGQTGQSAQADQTTQTVQVEQVSQSDEMKKLQGSSSHAPILSFIGVQGIGKTSMAKSIASALGRKFVRISLGAIGHVTELRGTPRGNVDAEPGQIIKALTRTGVMNPVILLDEIDKVSSDTGLRS
ncbi:MAG TPA: AAA family ATPase, partial [bacterium]|nr:AAA family ATPase [bacterium]